MSIELNKRKVNGRPTYTIRVRAWIDGGIKNFRIAKDDDGNYFTSKKEAEKYEFEFKKRHAPISSPNEITINQLWDKYLEYAKSQIQSTSVYEKEKSITKHFLPTFGNRPVKSIKPSELMEWQNELTAAGYAFETKRSIRYKVSSLFTFGYDYYDLPHPLKKVKNFKNLEFNREKIQFWTPEQFNEFISVVNKPMDKLFFTNQYVTGMREGETIALSRADILDKSINVNKSVTYKVYNEPLGYKVKTTKNIYSIRTSFLPAPLKTAYENYFKWQDENQNDTTFIFGGDRPVHPNSLRNRFTAYINKINTTNRQEEKPLLPKIKIHDLRHSCASYLLNAGVSFQAVAEQLGHKDARETIETYAHLLPSARDELHKAMEQEMPFLQKCT